MRSYEEMNPIDQKIMLLNMAGRSIRLEGMNTSADQVVKEIKELKQKKVRSILQQSNPQKDE